MAIRAAGFVQQLPAPSMVRCESRPSTMGHITLGTKQTGAPSAGNPHAGCDVAGAGNGFTVWLLRHSQRKRGATARLDLRNTAPVLDPTNRVQEMRFGAFCWLWQSTCLYSPLRVNLSASWTVAGYTARWIGDTAGRQQKSKQVRGQRESGVCCLDS